ncbi:membrane protein [Streptococcus thermophilus MTCC 5460]|nr:membrane protein [Streptococcus thermophilus MTCC 5460]
MFTSVTKKSASEHFFTYIGLTIFSLVFTFVYERFSYGESSTFVVSFFVKINNFLHIQVICLAEKVV